MSRHGHDRYVNQTLGERFHIKRPLAAGGMARVYVARDNTTGGRTAVKVLVPQPENGEMVERMRREASALERLDHPNIVKTVGHGVTDDGGYFIAMELIEGPSITEFIKANRTEPEGVLRLVMQVCSALRHAHRKGIVHRDLKASNLLVATDETGRTRVKLIDFGVVKLTDEETLSGNRHLFGSVHTIAPEQVRGESVDHRADIYSLGVLSYRMLAGQYPYHSRVAAETISQHVHADIPVLEDHDLPYGLAELVARCMAKQPDERYANVQELMDDLSRVVEVPTSAFTKPLKPLALPAPAPEVSPVEAENRSARMAVLAGAVLLAAAALFWVLSGG